MDIHPILHEAEFHLPQKNNVCVHLLRNAYLERPHGDGAHCNFFSEETDLFVHLRGAQNIEKRFIVFGGVDR